jgi:hypothetical protein
MATVVIGMTVSLDGFVDDQTGSVARIDMMPVLLGSGRRLFEDGLERVQLEKLGMQEVGSRTSLTFHIKKS